jgi:hypothetical protein
MLVSIIGEAGYIADKGLAVSCRENILAVIRFDVNIGKAAHC